MATVIKTSAPGNKTRRSRMNRKMAAGLAVTAGALAALAACSSPSSSSSAPAASAPASSAASSGGIPQQFGRGAGFAERLAVVQPDRPHQARRRAGGSPQGQEPLGGQRRDGRQRRGGLLEGRAGRLPRRLQGPRPPVQPLHLLRAAERQADRAELRARDAAVAGHHRLLDLRDRPGVREGHHRHRHEQGHLRAAHRLAAARHRRGGPVPRHAEPDSRSSRPEWR